MRTRVASEVDEPRSGPSKAVWIAVAVAALVVLLLGWRFLSGNKAETPATVTRSAPVVSSGTMNQAPPPTSATTQPSAPAVPASSEPTRGAGAPGWYVIAYTYNHEDQAAHKVQSLRRNHNSMHPQVFTPTGHAPYLISLGGAMSQDEAETVLRHARRSGLPRDTFVRHY